VGAPSLADAVAAVLTCRAVGCVTRATVVVSWSDPTPHLQDIRLCDPHARILLAAFDSPRPPRCEQCGSGAEFVSVRTLKGP